ncbi:hypothetical protein HHK36_023421 [Tetracentron sinense]|uniref:Prolamin-like domain-containing protein n=1 Tax=Tetracentron sinense TaxID=13715 RepID=A0A834YNN8_TETSI|nr:hypothetical protein HHK36_023421 [Tetracentron sinense]
MSVLVLRLIGSAWKEKETGMEIPVRRTEKAPTQEPAFIAMFVALGQASLEPSNKQVDFFGLDPEIGQCLASLQTVEGCMEEVLTSFLSFQVGLLGPKCCNAITKISETCWPKMFPLNPLFPPMLKDYCARLATPGPTQ